MKPSASAVLSLLLGSGLRLCGLTRDGYWIDEASAVLVASHSFSDIVEGLGVRLHPPLFYFLLHVWMRIGNSAFITRLFSVMFGVASIALVYRLARDVLDQRTAATASFLLAISPAHIWYSQEARMYALLVLLTTLSFYLGWRWVEDKRLVYWLGHVLISGAALYTQYLAAFVLITGGLGFTVVLATQRRHRDLALWWLAQLCVALTFLPWLPTLRRQIGFDTPWISSPTLAAVRRTWLYLGFGGGWDGNPLSYLRLFLLLAIVGAALFQVIRQRKRDNLLLPLTYSLVPAILMTCISFVKPIYQDKQFLIVLPMLLVVVGGTLGRGNGIRFLAGVALFAALTAGPLVRNYTVRQKQEWRETSQYIEAHWEPGDVIYYNAGVASAGTKFYLDTSLPQIGYPILWDLEKGGRYGSPTSADQVNEQFRDLAQHFERLWLIRYYPSYWDPGGHICRWLEDHARRRAVPDFYGVDLRLYSLVRK